MKKISMVKMNEIFEKLGEHSNSKGDLNPDMESFTNAPYYRINIYKKLLLAKNHYMKGIYLSLNIKESIGDAFEGVGRDMSLENEDKLMNFSEYLLYSRAFTYIKDCNFDKSWVKELEASANIEFLEALQEAIKFHEVYEEYEKCEQLKKLEFILGEKLGKG